MSRITSGICSRRPNFLAPGRTGSWSGSGVQKPVFSFTLDEYIGVDFLFFSATSYYPLPRGYPRRERVAILLPTHFILTQWCYLSKDALCSSGFPLDVSVSSHALGVSPILVGRRNDFTGVLGFLRGVVCDFIFIRFYSFLDIFWSIFFFLILHTLEECTGSGVICPLFGYVSVCVLYLFMHCLWFVGDVQFIYIYSILVDLHRTMRAVLNNMWLPNRTFEPILRANCRFGGEKWD